MNEGTAAAILVLFDSDDEEEGETKGCGSQLCVREERHGMSIM